MDGVLTEIVAMVVMAIDATAMDEMATNGKTMRWRADNGRRTREGECERGRRIKKNSWTFFLFGRGGWSSRALKGG